MILCCAVERAGITTKVVSNQHKIAIKLLGIDPETKNSDDDIVIFQVKDQARTSFTKTNMILKIENVASCRLVTVLENPG